MTQVLPFNWTLYSREEREFTHYLGHDIRQDPLPFLAILIRDLHLEEPVSIADVRYEMAFFRDAFHHKLITQHHELRSQKFDLVIILSNRIWIIVEAKAFMPFDHAQMANMRRATEYMLESSRFIAGIRTLAICSSRVKSPSQDTLGCYETIIRWDEIATLYPTNAGIYLRADSLYRENGQGRS